MAFALDVLRLVCDQLVRKLADRQNVQHGLRQVLVSSYDDVGMLNSRIRKRLPGGCIRRGRATRDRGVGAPSAHDPPLRRIDASAEGELKLAPPLGGLSVSIRSPSKAALFSKVTLLLQQLPHEVTLIGLRCGHSRVARYVLGLSGHLVLCGAGALVGNCVPACVALLGALPASVGPLANAPAGVSRAFSSHVDQMPGIPSSCPS